MVYSNRTYLDYNATAPVLPEVLESIKMGQWPMGNPSSVHTCGKKAKRKIGEVRDELYSIFKLEEREFDLFFHSGATEGINTFVKSLSLQAFAAKKEFLFLYSNVDHSCVVNQVCFIETHGQKTAVYPVNEQGDVDLDALEALLDDVDFDKTDVLVNWTWVNNETGVVNVLSDIAEIKEKYPITVHVDAVQAIGKIADYAELSHELDAYTFSAHKFGALKGAGFSFVRTNLMKALLNGGGQQGKLRSGTENTWGIFSISEAIKVMKEFYNFPSQNEAKEYIEQMLIFLMGDKGHIAGLEAKERNGNTIYFILDEVKAQTVAMALDMAGMDVSNGSACSSGAVIPSRVLLAMGYTEDQAISAIRLSFSAFFKKEEAIELWPRLESVLKRFVD